MRCKEMCGYTIKQLYEVVEVEKLQSAKSPAYRFNGPQALGIGTLWMLHKLNLDLVAIAQTTYECNCTFAIVAHRTVCWEVALLHAPAENCKDSDRKQTGRNEGEAQYTTKKIAQYTRRNKCNAQVRRSAKHSEE
jgi:hypothetical protein